MVVRALAFDVFGTLVDWRSGVSAAFAAVGLPDDDNELADAWRARYRPILAEVNGGAQPWGNFDELHLLTLEELLAERGIDLALEDRHRLVGTWHRLAPWPDVRAGLDELRHDLVTATLSNGHLALLVDLVRHGDLRVDCVLSAELAHIYKPAPEAYRVAVALLGLEPAEVMMVAAHPWDLAGAREAGLATAFVNRPLEYGPGSPSREDRDADLSVSDLQELAQRLASRVTASSSRPRSTEPAR